MLSVIGKEKIAYRCGEFQDVFIPPKFVYISQNFFRSYKCIQCGWCCLPVTLDYYEYNFGIAKERYPEIAGNFEEAEVEVNGTKRKVFVFEQAKKNKNIKKCVFLENNSCSIHEQNPWGCRFELYKMRKTRGGGYLTLQRPSRAWINRQGTCASCQLHPFDKDCYEMGVRYLEELQKIADLFNVKTWLPEILEILKKVDYNKIPKDKIPVGVNLELYKQISKECYNE